MAKTIEITQDDIVSEFDFDELTGDMDCRLSEPLRRDAVLSNLERRAAEHCAESVRAELRGDEQAASDHRGSHDDLRSYVRQLRRRPPPLPGTKHENTVSLQVME